MHTLEPSRAPSDAHPEVDEVPLCRRESENEQASGSNSFVLHIFSSSCRDSWNAELAGSEISTRTCTGSEHRVGKGGSETHVIKVLDKPRQILALQIRKTTSILPPAEEVAELLVKLRRSSVEVAELL